MQFTTLTVLLASVAAALAMPALEERGQTATLTYDQTYDNAKGSLNTVACSNGEHGLVDSTCVALLSCLVSLNGLRRVPDLR